VSRLIYGATNGTPPKSGDVADTHILIRVRNDDIASITKDVLPRRHVIGGVLEWSMDTLYNLAIIVAFPILK